MKKKIIKILITIGIIIGCVIVYKVVNRPQGISVSEACTLEDGFYTLSLVTQGHDGKESVGQFYKYNKSLYYISTVHYFFLFKPDRHPELSLDSYLYSYDCDTKIAKNMNMDNHNFYKINMRQGGKGIMVMTFEGLLESPYTYFIMNLDTNSLEKVVIEDFSGFDKYKIQIKEGVKGIYNEIKFNEYYSGLSFDEYRNDEDVFNGKYSYEIDNINTNLIGDITDTIRGSREWLTISVAKIDLLNKKIIFIK